MSSDFIQNQITLIAFKAVKFSFETIDFEDRNDVSNKFDIDLLNIRFEDAEDHFAKAFIVVADVVLEEQKQVFKFNTEYHVVFKCGQDINEEFLSSAFARIAAPAIGFPYLRAFISSVSVQAGFPPVILPSINFVKFAEEQEKKNNSA